MPTIGTGERQLYISDSGAVEVVQQRPLCSSHKLRQSTSSMLNHKVSVTLTNITRLRTVYIDIPSANIQTTDPYRRTVCAAHKLFFLPVLFTVSLVIYIVINLILSILLSKICEAFLYWRPTSYALSVISNQDVGSQVCSSKIQLLDLLLEPDLNGGVNQFREINLVLRQANLFLYQ